MAGFLKVCVCVCVCARDCVHVGAKTVHVCALEHVLACAPRALQLISLWLKIR